MIPITVSSIKEFDPSVVDGFMLIPMIICSPSGCNYDEVDNKRFSYLERSYPDSTIV